MSGGSLDYFYGMLENHVGDFKDKELDDLVRDLAKLFYEREWFLSSDTNEGRWREARNAFKAKWFRGDARKDRIEQYLTEIRQEVLESFGILDEYCKGCTHFTPCTKEGYDEYGDCDITSGCLMHRSEHCEKFVRKEDKHDN